MEGKGGMLSHMKCLEYQPLKLEWERALQEGEQRRCPGCKILGRKNEACTHIKCANWKTMWCYFCGGSENTVDRPGSVGDISNHNVLWETNPKRCPMYLTIISAVDSRWDFKTDLEAQKFFHKLLLYKQIRNFIQSHSIEKFNALCDVFPSVNSYRDMVEEALTMDLTLIKRK